MRTTLSLAALAALVASSSAAALPERAGCAQYNQITCTGEYIVGKLYVRNPDGSLHNAYFSPAGKKLATKYNGTPAPTYAQFAIKVCTDNAYDKRQESGYPSIEGFLVPNGHRSEALTLAGNFGFTEGAERQLYADTLDVSCSNSKNRNQYFGFYQNSTSSGAEFYSLAYSGIPTGATPGGGYSPVHGSSSDSQNIFISEKYTTKGFNIDGYVNLFGYALELHP
ncbi:hypothetical protein OC846_006101 [Tilletia horrida]|uniref:Uncharacterized protein n=1 Tax=Tilletia horrida TaxID=155126 RepID=A0AAN6JVC9_9BASI|nr:hypothetical protein OC846_006101 [Tilletia horrida]